MLLPKAAGARRGVAVLPGVMVVERMHSMSDGTTCRTCGFRSKAGNCLRKWYTPWRRALGGYIIHAPAAADDPACELFAVTHLAPSEVKMRKELGLSPL